MTKNLDKGCFCSHDLKTFGRVDDFKNDWIEDPVRWSTDGLYCRLGVVKNENVLVIVVKFSSDVQSFFNRPDFCRENT